MYYARARYYNPSSGRWMSRDGVLDPAKRYSPAGLACYVYCENRPTAAWDPDGEFDLFAFFFDTISGTVNGFMNFLKTGNPLDIVLGTLSGTLSGVMQGFCIPLYVSFSTQGWSAGVGVGTGSMNAGGGVHSSWDGSSFGFNVNAGLGAKNGPGVGLSFGMDYNRQGGWGTTIGANASIGLGDDGKTNLSFGGNISFDSQGISGGGFNTGLSTKSYVNENDGSYNTFGNSFGMNFGRDGPSFSYNITGGNYDGTKNSMSINESVGITIGPRGQITPTGSQTASRYYNLQAAEEENKASVTTPGKSPHIYYDGTYAADGAKPDVQDGILYTQLIQNSNGEIAVLYLDSKGNFVKMEPVNGPQDAGFNPSERYLNAGKDYHQALHKGEPGFFESRVAKGGDNTQFQDDMKKFYSDFSEGVYFNQDGSLDIEKMNNFIDDISNKYEFVDAHTNDVKWANLFDKGAFYHDLRGALLEYYYSQTIHPYVTENYKVRPEMMGKFIPARNAYWKNIVESDRALVVDARAALQVKGYGNIAPNAQDKRYQKLYNDNGWGNEFMTTLYGNSMVLIFDNVVNDWSKNHNNAGYEYPFVNQSEVIKRAADFK